MADDLHHPPQAHEIVPRQDLDFGLGGDIPKYWFGGDPFKTRFFDALSTLFPEGEKFFIACVRDYRDRISDPELQQQVRDFTRQEGQHGMVHTRFNDRLRQQGIDVDRILKFQVDLMFGFFRKHFPRAFTLAQTAAAEHMTAIMAHGFFARRETLETADPRIRAMYAWHAIEEIEHKAVAFDVLQKVAGAGYFTRILAMLQVSWSFPLHVFMIMRHMFKVDGFSLRQRAGLWLRGLWWLYKPGGLYAPVIGHYLAYFKPGYHPWEAGQMGSYQRWRETYDATGDPIAAGNALHAYGV
ncbi:MAG: metal-dependent hydrolase [Nevskia sp.]|nr:metal-dependent hydrolase [Nevskia sp.]